MFELLSVVVPTHNRAVLLGEQMEALAQQTYGGGWELIVADNGSSDQTAAVVRTFEDRLPLRFVSATERSGASYARNCGAKAARGEFLFFIDDDDRVTPSWLEAMAHAAEQWDVIKGNNRNLRFDGDKPEAVPALDVHGLPAAFGFLPSVYASNSGIRRGLFEQLGGFDERYARFEDTQLYWRAQLAGCSTGFATDAVVDYRLRVGLWPVFDQAYQDSKALPQLYREFRQRGMPRTPVRTALRLWARTVKHVPDRIGSPRGREEIVREFGWWLGRLAGSMKRRVLYL